MTDISHWTKMLKVTRVFPAVLASTLVIVAAADTASAETLDHLRLQLNKPPPKVPAGKGIERPTYKTPVPAPSPVDPNSRARGELPADRYPKSDDE